ncbi:polyribonucleotide nucleotidyltransferase [Pontibacter sp. BT310]|uniref:Polyribonucleotide nucleotidyltransferase n=1 Tax=Pontibacter populi TaxID=890055 RepID=A0ABS6XA61_9BACT|nr:MULTISPECIES: polyribonucleotide nucleotidyltransferase [Pontibacter]MBJ6117934.1 polyribonucleotide nucleotidyltransferase [Pontibacter sp. BT310]MBR0570361.1 polyribonucleotide nucleotidyltransferase [Microvirga sp. STS03]MBW3364787.1 polyribonucleotide nucleotidyltransferase [Pontibacter populi]
MSQNAITKTISLPDGREITIETGKLAKQADGSVVVKMGNTMLLAAIVSNKEAREGVDFLPLSVDYQEKFASSGKIPGGFLRREARLSDYEILVSRLVDRVLRPLFPDDYHAETQMTIHMISADTEIMPDALAALAASAALAVSDIPFNGPISEVRVARIDGQLVINPTVSNLQRADIDMMVGASMDSVVMVEGEMSEVSEAEMLEAIKFAHEAIKVQCQAQLELAEMVGKLQKREYSHETHDEALREKVRTATYDKAYEVAMRGRANKSERKDGFAAVLNEFVESLGEDHGYDMGLIKTYYHDVEKEAVRNMILDERVRLDGRKLDEIRPIWSEVNYLPATHGSAVFTRGETQSLTTVTLGTKLDEQMIDSAMVSGTNKFLLHYNFPAFSTGEVKPNRGPGRREIGHGNLALRALKKVLPSSEDNPYTIRIVSDILESNGSSSMATVCAGSLALMDAGVPIKGGVSGIAMGLITDEKTGKFAVLSDILGDEDHLGDMDFKVTGTKDGITACQMDIKVHGLSYDVLSQALEQAKAGRLHILGEMNKTISSPNADYKPHTPRSFNMIIDKEFIGAVIGPGGKVIQQIQKDTGATIIIEEKNEKGHVNIFASDQDSMNSAVSKIKGIVAQPEIGEVYIGKVKSIQPYGAFVEFMAGKDGLLHISEIKHERVETMDGVLEVGEEVKVKLIDVDKKTGKFKLSRKAILPRPEAPQQNQ